MKTSGREGWQAFHRRRQSSGKLPSWPNETMVRILFGADYLANRPSFPAQSRVLDIGCGFGQNLLPFVERGFECFGVEIDPAIVQIARQIAKERDAPITFEVGRNRALPFPDASFDLALSVDTLHYEPDEAAANAAIREFARILKPTGVLYLSTIGPLHDMYKTAEKFPDGCFRVQNYDFRDGEMMFSFAAEQALAEALGKSFAVVETARSTQHLMRANLDWLIGVTQRKRS